MADKEKASATVVVDATEEETAARVKEQEAEYGTYVATTLIRHNGTPAYRKGDAVPASNVAKYGYANSGLVVKIASAQGKQVIEEIVASRSLENTVPEQVSLGVQAG